MFKNIVTTIDSSPEENIGLGKNVVDVFVCTYGLTKLEPHVFNLKHIVVARMRLSTQSTR